ncbi:MAG: hypothetical protein ABEJ57_09530 [Halobacteriaceae archaeon]
MGDVERLRDSTQILVGEDVLDAVDVDLEEEFAVTVTEREDHVHIVGSPVVIKDVSAFLARNGITLR